MLGTRGTPTPLPGRLRCLPPPPAARWQQESYTGCIDMPALYAASGGANRKLREVYAASGGTNRKLKEMYAASGGANRKIFSGVDAVVTLSAIGNLDKKTTVSFTFNADGSGNISYRNNRESISTEWDISFLITLPDALAWGKSDPLIVISNAYQEFDGTYVSYSRYEDDDGVPHRLLDVQPGLRERDGRYNYKYYLGGYNQATATRNVKANVAGVSNSFTVTFSFRCYGNRNADGRYYLSWPAGSWSILGQPLNNIEGFSFKHP